MRIATMLIASTILVAACGDNHPSSPVAARSSASASVEPADQPVKAAGKTGGQGVTLTTVVSALAHMDGVSITSRNAIATCPTGTKVTGGGYWIDAGPMSARVQINAPDGGTTWRVLINAAAAEVMDFHAYAICASA
jgi:hypothetical protein